MTFSALEESQDQGTPASLFLIEYGDDADAFYAYTDSESKITFGGRTYQPVTIGRDKITSSGTLDRTTLEIQINPAAEVVQLYRAGAPSHVVRLTIYQGHVDDPANEFLVVWTGRIISINQSSRFATIAGEPVSTSLRRAGLRRHYQYGCPWSLYGPECKASQAAATVTAPAVEIGQNVIGFADGWQGTRIKTKFQGGFVQWADAGSNVTQTRTILKVSEGDPAADPVVPDRLLINGQVVGLDVGGTVTIVLGCNHQLTDCRDLHDNVLNYGGQPFIPKTNPTGPRNQFY